MVREKVRKGMKEGELVYIPDFSIQLFYFLLSIPSLHQVKLFFIALAVLFFGKENLYRS